MVQGWMWLWTQQKQMFLVFTISFLVFECNFIFHWVDSCAKCHVLSRLIICLVFSYPRSQLVYVSLYDLLPSCLLITLQLVSNCYWLCFEWNFEWSRISRIDWNQLNQKMDVWNVCFSHSQFCNAIVFCALFDTCRIYKENMVQN